MSAPIFPTRRSVWLACMLALGLLSACAVGPDFVAPEAPAVNRYTAETQVPDTVAADGLAQHFSADTRLPADWWRLFKSPEMDAIVARVLKNNPGLQASEATLRQSQDSVRAAYGVFFPQAGLNAEGRRQRSAPVQEGSSAPSTVFNFVSLGGSISYVLDVFGSSRRMVEGLRAQADNQHYLNRAAYLMLSANVVNTCIARAAYAEQLSLTQELIGLEREQLQQAHVQFNAGTLSYASMLNLQNQLAGYEAGLAPLKLKLEQADHLLASLQGKTPAESSTPQMTVAQLSLPQDLPLSLPSGLVRQRPDILSSEALLHVASADVGVATAAMFPSISLTGSFGMAGTSWGQMSAANGKFWSVGPSLDLPLLTSPNAWYQRKAAQDAYLAAQANYRQTVLTAFNQVADTLAALQHDAEALQARTEARDAARRSAQLLRINYQTGIAAYSDLLIAELQWKQTEIDHLQALALRQQDTVALFVALGGGWWNADKVQGMQP